MAYPLLALLTLASHASVTLAAEKGEVTALPMPFFWPQDNPVPVAADILGVDKDSRTTYVLHDDRTGPITFSADGLAGTMTYIIGSNTASVNYVMTNEGTVATAVGSCSFSATSIGSPATCTLSADDLLTTQTETMTAATVTIGTVAPTVTIQTSEPGTSKTSPTTTTTNGTGAGTGNAPTPSKTNASAAHVASIGAVFLSSTMMILSFVF